MPEEETVKRARKGKRQGKAPSTHAGKSAREESHGTRRGKRGARKKAGAIGSSKTRGAEVVLMFPPHGRFSAKGHHGRIMFGILHTNGHESASTPAASRQRRATAKRKTSSGRSKAARKTDRAKSKSKSKSKSKNVRT